MAIEVYQGSDVEKEFSAALSHDGQITILLEKMEDRYILLMHTEKSMRELCWPSYRYLDRGENINIARIVKARKMVEVSEDKWRLIGETQKHHIFFHSKGLVNLLDETVAEVHLMNVENEILESINIGVMEYLAVQTKKLRFEELWNLYRQIETKRLSPLEFEDTRSYLEIMILEATSPNQKAF